MNINEGLELEGLLFSIMDEFRFVFFPEKWSSSFLDYSKNEILTLLYLYRYKSANMTQISEYINAPLNTSTGVVNRLENKKMIERIRSNEDRRIVQITLTEKATEYLKEEIKLWQGYLNNIHSKLTDSEIATAFNIFLKVKSVFTEAKSSETPDGGKKKKIKKIIIE